jgi:hypothetical protein
MNAIKKFFGWAFCTEAYMATLSDEQIAIRALGRKGYRKASAQLEEEKRKLDALLARLREFSS